MALAATLDERRLLAGSVITVDAGFTARELAADLRARGAHWILRVKGNQKTLHARLTALPWAQVPEAARVRSVGHGRVETRTIRVIDLAGSDDGHGEFDPHAAQALKIVRRRRTRRGRWRIEGVLHWVRDLVLAEDHSQVRTGSGPTNLAVL